MPHRVHPPVVAVHDPKPWIHGTQVPVRVVLHDTESHDTAGIGDIAGIFSFWHTQLIDGKLAKYGAHFIVDKDGNVGVGGHPNELQWHVGNLNTNSIGVEQMGFASFTRAIWKKTHRRQLFAVAHLLAYLHQEYHIPLRVPADPREPGITTHARVGAAGIDPSGHTDPGAGYPLFQVVTLARLIKAFGGRPIKSRFLGR